MEEKVQILIDKVRPYIQMHGGDVSLESIKNGVVKLKVSGSCSNCPLAHQTFDEMLGSMIKDEVPDIKKVEVI